LSIISLAIAMAYLLLVLVGAVGVLSLLVWLFGERPSGAETQGVNVRSVGNKQKVREGGTPSIEIELSHSEDRAA
jgi:hypothetical protein